MLEVKVKYFNGQIGKVIDDKVQCLEPAVPGGVLEIDVTDVVFNDEIDDVTFGELFGVFADSDGKTADAVIVFHVFHLNIMG